MDYKARSSEEIVTYLKSVSRQRGHQVLQIAQKDGDEDFISRVADGIKVVQDCAWEKKEKCYAYGGEYLPCESRKNQRLHNVWTGMLLRGLETEGCYKDVYVGDEFLDFGVFLKWYKSQAGYGYKDCEIDKDLLSVGAGCYSPKTCALLPQELNGTLVERNSLNGLPTGVVAHKNGSFLAKHKNKHISTYRTVEDAAEAYKSVKEAHVRYLAEKWKWRLEPHVYDALMAYKLPDFLANPRH